MTQKPYRTSYTLAEVKSMLHRLGPRGPLWTSTGVQALYEGLAGEWRRLMLRAGVAVAQFLGSTATETLDTWIAEYGLDTDECTSVPAAEADQQAFVAAAETAQGGQSASYFVAVAASMGIAITIDEGPTAPYPTPECGVAECGDELTGADGPFVWIVNAPSATSSTLRAALECRFEKIKPANTWVEYVYA